jgi:hypothetical protein
MADASADIPLGLVKTTLRVGVIAPTVWMGDNQEKNMEVLLAMKERDPSTKLPNSSFIRTWVTLVKALLIS